MKLADPTKLVFDLTKKANEIRKKRAGGGWGWRDGIVVYIDPEARCPLCDKSFPTRRVWIVDEAAWRLPRQFRLRDGSRVDSEGIVYHPHVQDSGSYMCRGNSKSPSQLLFNGINTEYAPHWFLWDMDHKCETFKMDNCPLCEKEVPKFTLNQGYAGKGLCSPVCLEKARMLRCVSCFKLKDPQDERPRTKCQACKQAEVRYQTVLDAANSAATFTTLNLDTLLGQRNR